MRGAGRAPPLSPSPVWGPGEQPPARPWAGDVHLHEVLLLHHPRYPGAPRFPHSHSSPALGRGTLPSSAPSPTADSPMHNFFLLGGHPRPSQGSPGAPAALLGGAWRGTPHVGVHRCHQQLLPHCRWGYWWQQGGSPPQHPSSLPFPLLLSFP